LQNQNKSFTHVSGSEANKSILGQPEVDRKIDLNGSKRRWQDGFYEIKFEAQICKLDSASPFLPILSVAIGKQVSNPVNSLFPKIENQGRFPNARCLGVFFIDGS